MNRWFLVGLWFGWMWVGTSCKNESLQPKTEMNQATSAAPMASDPPVVSADRPSIKLGVGGGGGERGANAVAMESHEWKEALQLALRERRELTVKYREMTVDTMSVVARCGSKLRISSVGANLDTPYNNPKGFIVVADSTAEKMLQNHQDEPGCTVAYALYWARDEDGHSDIVVRFGLNAASSSTLWRVLDTGSFERLDPEQLPTRFFSDRLVRAASFFAEVSDEPERAMGYILAAEAADPANPRVAGVKAEILAKSAPAEAILHLTQFMAKHGEDAGLLGTLAALYLENGTADDKSKADETIAKALKLNPNHFKVIAAKAERQRDLSDFVGAIATYLTLDQVDPYNNTFRFNLATLYLETGQTNEALAQLNRYLQEFPEDLDALYLRASNKLRLGDHEGALRDVEVLLKVAPESPEVLRFADTVKQAKTDSAKDAAPAPQ